MHLDRDPTDPRVAQRDRIHQELDQLVADWQRDIPPRAVLNVLVSVSRRLFLKLEDGDDPVRPSRRGRAS